MAMESLGFRFTVGQDLCDRRQGETSEHLPISLVDLVASLAFHFRGSVMSFGAAFEEVKGGSRDFSSSRHQLIDAGFFPRGLSRILKRRALNTLGYSPYRTAVRSTTTGLG